MGGGGASGDVTAAGVNGTLAQAVQGINNGISLGTITNALNYPNSTGNNTTTQLAPGASFTGAIETVLSLQAAQVQVVCDQPYTVTINQYIDAAGLKLVSTDVLSRSGGVPMNENVTLPGNYFNLVLKNVGTAATTNLTLATTFGIMATTPRTMGHSERDESFPVTDADSVVQVVPDVTGVDLAQIYDFNIAAQDIVTNEVTSNGPLFMQMSVSPWMDDSASTITLKQEFTLPHRLEAELSLSQRIRGIYTTLDVYSNDLGGAVAAQTPITLTSIQQAATTLTAVLSSRYLGNIGDSVSIFGVTDNRLNYTNLIVGSIDALGTTLNFFSADGITLPSLTVGPFASQGSIVRDDQLDGAQNGYRLKFEGTAPTSATFLTRVNGGNAMASGTLNSSQLVTIASTASVYTQMQNGYGEVKASNRYQVVAEPESLCLLDKAIDNASAVYGARVLRTNVKPALQKNYKVRLKTDAARSLPRPVAKIVSAVKASASTTATVTTESAHGLVTGNWINLWGARDQVNFVNTSIVQVTVLTATTFTVAWGTAAIATTYGGAVGLANGGLGQPGVIAPVVSTAARASNGEVTLIGNTTWSGVNIGDHVEIIGVRVDGTGADFGIDGAYKVKTLSTTTLILTPIVDYMGATRSPVGGVLSVTNCGGGVVQRVAYRIHDLGIAKYGQQEVKLFGQGSTRFDASIPVQVLNPTTTVTVTQGTAAAISATDGSGGWPIRPSITGIADVVSAAITSTSTSASILNDKGNGFQINVPVTVVTGTAPTMDIRIEESFDGGTNWVTLYEMQRITAVGSYNTPILKATGRTIRYVRTITGTTPSFTTAINRTLLPFINASPQKRIMDRSVVTTTLNSTTPVLFSGEANSVQLVVNMGAIATTAPQFQIEGSEDNANWYPIGTPLTSVASSTVEITYQDKSATFLRARVSTAGVGSTLGYVSLKAWS